MRKITLLYISLILLLFSRCTNDIESIVGDELVNKDGSIAFCTADTIISRGTPQDKLTAYDKVNLIAYDHTGNYVDGRELFRKTELIKSGDADKLKWSYSPPMFWPVDKKMSFLAYAIESKIPYATEPNKPGVYIKDNGATKAPTIEYVVPTDDVRKQPDLLVTAQLDSKKANSIILEMKHALACVSFCATGPDKMTVKSLKVNKVFKKGWFSLDDPDIKWTVDPNSKDLTALEPGINPDLPLEEQPNQNNYLMTPDGYLMMIPQAINNATIDVVYQNIADKTETKITYSLPSSVEWKPGNKYIYKFGENLEEVVVYYEKYADESFGFQSKKVDLAPIVDDKVIVEAGYGVLTKSRLVSSTPTIKLGDGTPINTKKVESVSGGYNLYAVSQTSVDGSKTFDLPLTISTLAVYFDSNDESCGKIIPHFAKGVADYDNTAIPYAIRTPQQMRNVSAITTDDYFAASYGRTFRQELDLDFSATKIGGGTLTGPVVDQAFAGTFTTVLSKKITKVNISAPGEDKVALFAVSNGSINDIILTASTIVGRDFVGGIVGENYWAGQVNRPQVIGTRDVTEMIKISGRTDVGGVVGVNRGFITGNSAIEEATGVTVAEVSGWVNITGTGNNVGGIAGENALNSINKVLVYGVFVKGAGFDNVDDARIVISGVNYVGGIVGDNAVEVNGNITGTGATASNMPDVAGIVEIKGAEGVGGIAGRNNGKLNAVTVRLGRATPMKITGTGNYVGGIVGENWGTLGVDNETNFISIRGNIEISGNFGVGGIAGVNAGSANLTNCFVHDFQTKGTSRGYFAPKITGASYVGGIAGSNSAAINNCSVFSTSATRLFVTANYDRAGGIVGYNIAGSGISKCSFVGLVEVNAKRQDAGGICGNNSSGTTISECWVGQSDGYSIISNAQTKLKLPVDPPAGQISFGIPSITSPMYVGGIVGLNDGGAITNITVSDNVYIGKPDIAGGDGTIYVGGIVGGNIASDGVKNIISNCKVINATGKNVVIRGTSNIGGIAGLNNGIVRDCSASGIQALPLTLTGLGTIGGIVGQNGGNSDITTSPFFGNTNTVVKNCKVTGYVTIAGSQGAWGYASHVGGVAGTNGPNNAINNIEKCVVQGTAAGSITISIGGDANQKIGTAGGIVGTNNGYLLSCDVQNTTITSTQYFAGGIAGQTTSLGASYAPPAGYRSNITDCRVCSGVTISGKDVIAGQIPVKPGALVGYIDVAVLMTFGSATTPNLVNPSGVTVNGSVPIYNGGIVGFATNGATIEHSMTATSVRP